jgi:hypothetical protein
MSKKFSKKFSGIQATTARGRYKKLLALTEKPSRKTRQAQHTTYKKLAVKNRAMFAVFGINSFMCA